MDRRKSLALNGWAAYHILINSVMIFYVGNPVVSLRYVEYAPTNQTSVLKHTQTFFPKPKRIAR